MKKVWYTALVIMLTIGLIIPGMIFVPQANAAGKRVIVMFDPISSPGDRRNVVSRHNCSIIKMLSIIPAVVIHLPEQAAERARRAILANVLVIRIEDDVIVKASPKPDKPDKPDNDKKPPKEKQQPAEESLPWGIDRIDAELAWESSTGSGVKVAILDTGIDVGHPDLIDNISGGINIINPRKHYTDDNGHGTHVAGIVAAIDNQIGVIGVAPNASLYGVKVLNRSGSGWLSDVIAGMEWCIDNHIDIINMSLGTTVYVQSFYDAVNKVHSADIVQVAAAGNEGGPVNYPAAYWQTIAVAAIDSNDQITSWSNYGLRGDDFCAPGVDINSTYKGGDYKELDGTSMAAPHVAGIAALILEDLAEYTPVQVRGVLTSTADCLSEISSERQGAGLVDAEEAVTGEETP